MPLGPLLCSGGASNDVDVSGSKKLYSHDNRVTDSSGYGQDSRGWGGGSAVLMHLVIWALIDQT